MTMDRRKLLAWLILGILFGSAILTTVAFFVR